MKKKRILVILLIIVVVILALKACGGGSGSDEGAMDNAAETTEDYEVTEDEDQNTSDASDTDADSDADADADSDADSDDSSISPEFKETMDNYEAWFDHYCEVMKKYHENPSDMELMAEMTELVAEETKVLEEMENMDESEMNSAELAYYLEVTARIEQKLLEVADY